MQTAALFKVTTSGYVISNVASISSVILTPDGSNVARAQISWSTGGVGTREIDIRCTATASVIHNPALPESVGGADVTITLTSVGPCTVSIGLVPSQGGSISMVGPSRNFVSRATVLLKQSDSLVNQVTVVAL